jgi:ADP-ribose pyrophosphatase
MSTQARETLGAGRYVTLVRENGWEFLDRPNCRGIVIVVAVTPDQRLLLVEQWRQPVGARVIELPAGLAGDVPGEEHEPLENAARRELLEETGWDAEAFDLLGRCVPSPGATSEIVTYYQARGLRRVGGGGGDAHEDITVQVVPLRELDAWLRAREAEGRLVDMKLWAGLELRRHRSRA